MGICWRDRWWRLCIMRGSGDRAGEGGELEEEVEVVEL